ncbi:MAG: hypothetical protein C5B50_11145 [Verrucomicrobia bacterium]|nr:MAG: hypothetical protein C5B50_11145 [Verrucomicrobiota bacterium]
MAFSDKTHVVSYTNMSSAPPLGARASCPRVWGLLSSRAGCPRSQGILAGLFLLASTPFCPAQTPPQIVVQPQDQFACTGNDATFSVQATGSQPLVFFWFDNGSPVTGGVNSTPTGSSLTLFNVQLTDDGSDIYVVVTNHFGVTNSVDAFLHVSDPPQIISDPSDTTTPLGGFITFNVSAGPGPLVYSWWFQGMQLTNNLRTFGADTPNLAIMNAQLSDAGYYHAEVSNSCVLVDSLPARCYVGNPPNILGQPVNVLAPFQVPVQFHVSASGTPLSYQWYRNDVPIPFANSATLAISSATRQPVGIYHVVVFSPSGASVSDRVHLQVNLTYEGTILPRQEATDFLDALTNALRTITLPPTVITHGVPLLVSTIGATKQSWESNRCGVPPSHSMWLDYLSPRTESVKASTEGSSFPTVLAVYDTNLVQLACDVHSGYGGSSLLSFSALGRTDYLICVDGVSGTSGIARVAVGEVIRNVHYNPALSNGAFSFEMAGPYWYTTTLHSSTNAVQPSALWATQMVIQASTQDYVARFTNYNVRLDHQRFYNTAVNTNSAPP